MLFDEMIHIENEKKKNKLSVWQSATTKNHLIFLCLDFFAHQILSIALEHGIK